MSEEANVDFDVIVIGGGVAGSVAAYTLAGLGHEVLLIERAMEPGSKNLSGGVFYCRVMEQIFPDFIDEAPIERRITRNVVSLLNDSSAVNSDYWDQRLAEPVNAVTVLRAKLDMWLSEKCEEAGVTVMPGIKVDSLIIEGKQIVGVRAGEDELRSHVVVAADGVNSFIAQQAGIREKEPKKHLAIGVKSVIALPEKVLEDRFNVRDNCGAAYAMVGDATQGVTGGAFLYTNKESVSIGVVMRLDDLEASGLSSSHIHDHLLTHPAIAPLLEDGELLEYGCHLTIEDGPQMASHDLTRPGLVIIGDAAGFTLNTGLTIRGMDLAAGSALAASTAVHGALESGDFSQASMDRYLSELKSSFVGQDMETYAKAPAFLERQRMYKDYGRLAAEVFYGVFNHDLRPRRHISKIALAAFKASGLRCKHLISDALAAIKAL